MLYEAVSNMVVNGGNFYNAMSSILLKISIGGQIFGVLFRRFLDVAVIFPEILSK